MAATLSLIPGLGQLYVGKTKKGAALLCIDSGMAASLYFFPSRITWVLIGVIYLSTAIPAGFEAYFFAKTGRASTILDSKIYIVLMLLTTGLMALPLLWQQTRFSRRAKILWTLVVLLLAVLFFGSLLRWGAKIEKFLK